MTAQKEIYLKWSGVLIGTVVMMLVSALIVYPKITIENVSIALRISSLITAIFFLLVFIAKPLTKINSELGNSIENNRPYLWLILTISHLIHLYQIWLYYQLGQSCPVFIWLATLPLWIITVVFAVVEIINPQLFTRDRLTNFSYNIGIWYVWLIFTFAFGMAAMGNHLLFYNIPAFILFLAGGIFSGIIWWQKVFAKAV